MHGVKARAARWRWYAAFHGTATLLLVNSTRPAATPESRAVLAEPASTVKPELVQPTGVDAVRAWLERSYWVAQEYLESARTRDSCALLVSGTEKHSGAPLRALYFGSGNHRSYVLSLLYQEHHVEEEWPDVPVGRARRWLAAHRGRVDLVALDLPWPYDRHMRGRGLLEAPAWVDQKFDLPARWDDVFGKLRSSAKGEDLRKIRKYGLSCRVAEDEAAIRRFYHEMYVPHVTQRFGGAAYVEPEWKIQYCAGNGALMEVLREGEVVAGQVLFGDRDNLQFLWAGTVGGQFGQHSQGIFPALFYYGLLHAFENGYRTADYCGSRPLLTDGILQLKRRWGARIADGWSRDSLFSCRRTSRRAHTHSWPEIRSSHAWGASSSARSSWVTRRLSRRTSRVPGSCT